MSVAKTTCLESVKS